MNDFFDYRTQNIIYISKNKKWYTLIILIMLILILIVFYYVSISTTNYNKKKVNTFTNQNIDNSYIYCQTGECALDILTGIKKCSVDDNPVPYIFGREVCTLPYECTNDKYPFAVRGDESAYDNKCDDGVICRCVAKKQCDDRISEKFISSENPYMNNTGLKITFSTDNSNILTTNLEYCKLNPYYLKDTISPCSEITLNDNDSINYINRITNTDNSTYAKYYHIPNKNIQNLSINQIIGSDSNKSIISLGDSLKPASSYVINRKKMQECMNKYPCPSGFASYNVNNVDTFGLFTGDNIDNFIDDPLKTTFSCRFAKPCIRDIDDDDVDKCLLSIEKNETTDCVGYYDGLVSDNYIPPPEYDFILGYKNTRNINFIFDSINGVPTTYYPHVPRPNLTLRSYYYPIWDKNIKNNRCKRIKPLLDAIPIIRDGKIKAVRIDASGQDFNNFIRVNGHKGFYYKGNINKPLEIGIYNKDNREITINQESILTIGFDEIATYNDFDIRFGSNGYGLNPPWTPSYPTINYGIYNGRITCITVKPIYIVNSTELYNENNFPYIKIKKYYIN